MQIKDNKHPEYMADKAAAEQKFRAARYEEAAQLYEKWGLHDDAGRARRGAQTQFVKQVSLDLNRMLDQVRKDGLSIPYRCASCGSSVRIDASTNATTLGQCAHCGSRYDQGQMMDFLAKVLG